MFNPVGGAACHPWNGTNANPASFSCVTTPVLGDTWQGMIAFTGTTTYAIAIPAAASWARTTLAFQGVRLELVGGSPTFAPLNAMLLMLGL